jgi:hypothetical protein
MPSNYEEKAKELKAFERPREIETAADLMLLNMIHLVNGTSLLDISAGAKMLEIANISDVAFMKRFAKCGDWFEWISGELVAGQLANYQKPAYLEGFNPVSVDGSDVVEKGRSGQLYHLHYALNIFTLATHSFKITKEETGETLTNFTFRKGDLVIADRMYGTVKGIKHVKSCDADCILRLRTKCFAMYNEDGSAIDIGAKLQQLKCDECAEFPCWINAGRGERLEIRICAKKKSESACEKTRKKLHRREIKKQVELSNEAKMLNLYIIVATTLPDSISCGEVLETYRYRWQVENYFKRLKSIMDFGELPKKTEASSLSWLKGKFMIALLMEIFISGCFISPSGQIV